MEPADNRFSYGTALIRILSVEFSKKIVFVYNQ
jgi:hypothetical protein